MKSLEIKVHISGERLLSLKKLAGTEDDITKLRIVARTLINNMLDSVGKGLEACLEGRVGDIEIGENAKEDQENL